MLPDFPDLKQRFERQLTEWAEIEELRSAPMLSMTNRFRIHEGKRMGFIRDDDSAHDLEMREVESKIEFQRAELRKFDLLAIQDVFRKLIKGIVEAQARKMYEDISQAAEEVGNSISSGGDLQAEHFLEMLRRMRIDFDPATGSPKNLVWTIHPSRAESVFLKLREWDNSPVFRAEHERILQAKREEWNDRESRRKLVD